MAETLIILTPGEERVIRVRCGAAAVEESDAGAGAVDAPAQNQPNASNLPDLSPMPRKSRKNRKNNGLTRKVRKQSGGNSYMNFAKVHRKEVLNQHPELKSDVVAVARKIGEAWRKLPEADRKKY